VVYKGAAFGTCYLFPLFPGRSRRLYLRLLKNTKVMFRVSISRSAASVTCTPSFSPSNRIERPSSRTFFSFQSLCSFAFYKVARQWLVQRPLWCAIFGVRSNRVSDEGFRAFSTTSSCIGMAFMNGTNCTRSSPHTARIRRRFE